MQEILEPVVDSPPVRYVLENPELAAAQFTVASIVTGAATGFAGQVKGEREIDNIREEFDTDQAYEEAVMSRKKELEDEIKRDSALREIYNHVRHTYKSGKLGAYEEEASRINGTGFTREDEYFNQKFSDEDLE